jgi:gas vesicle protein
MTFLLGIFIGANVGCAVALFFFGMRARQSEQAQVEALLRIYRRRREC